MAKLKLLYLISDPKAAQGHRSPLLGIFRSFLQLQIKSAPLTKVAH